MINLDPSKPSFFEDRALGRTLFRAFDVYNDRDWIGRFLLEDIHPTYPNTLTTHSEIQQRVRGQGLGREMYFAGIKYCLEIGKNVWSSFDPSKDAVRVWKSKWLNDRVNIHPVLLGGVSIETLEPVMMYKVKGLKNDHS